MAMKKLEDIRPDVQTPQEYFNRLVAAGAAGRLPARGAKPGGENSFPAVCRYLTREGRQCGIGLLFSKEDAAVVEERLSGIIAMNTCAWEKLLPSWLSLDNAICIQNIHDGLLHWDQYRWVMNLKSLSVFSNCEVADAQAT